MYQNVGTLKMAPYVHLLKVYNSGSRKHEAALVINRFSRKRNVTGNLVQTVAQSNECERGGDTASLSCKHILLFCFRKVYYYCYNL